MNKLAYAGATAAHRANLADAPLQKKKRQLKGDYTLQQIALYRHKLIKPHAAILMASVTNDYAGIGQALGLKRGTVKSRLNRAREALEKAMAADRAPAP